MEAKNILFSAVVLVIFSVLAVRGSPIENVNKVSNQTSVKLVLDPNSKPSIGTRAIVLETNMPLKVQNEALLSVSTAYSYSSDKSTISQLIQNYMDSYEPNFYWNVVLNYDVATYYNYYRIILTEGLDTLLIFGLPR